MDQPIDIDLLKMVHTILLRHRQLLIDVVPMARRVSPSKINALHDNREQVDRVIGKVREILTVAE